jgi:hypothetical protein
MIPIRILLACGLLGLAGCATTGGQDAADSKLVKYSYTGPDFSGFTGVVSPWTTESRMTGYIVVNEIPPSTTIDFLDPDIDWPIVNLPEEFLFTDGARVITKRQLEDAVKDTGLRIDPNVYEVRAFSVRTDADGDIVAWDVLFVHDVRRSTYLTAHNGGIYGQDLTEIDATHFGCVATEKCTANVNYTSTGPVLDGTTYPGVWVKSELAQGDAE